MEVGYWIKYIPDNGIGQITNIEAVTGEIEIYWYDLKNTTIERQSAFSNIDEFEIIGKLSEHEELLMKLKYS